MSTSTNKTLLLFLCTLFALQSNVLSAFEDDFYTFSCSGNVIQDGDLESSDLKKKNWTFQGNTWQTTSNVNTGSKAIGMNNNDGTAGIYQKKSASPGQTYSLSVFAKSSTGYGDVGFRFLNSSNGILQDYKLDVDQSDNFNEYTLSGTAPAGTAYVQVFGIIYSGGTFYVDSYCLQLWNVTSPPSCSNSCDNENEFDDPVIFIDPTGTGNGWLGYINSSLEVCNNGNGTYSIRGSVIGGHDAEGWGGIGNPCGSQDGYYVNLLLTDRQTWAEFGGNYEENPANPNHTSWDYYQVSGTFTGLGCNSGTTVNVNSASAGYRMQVGFGANKHYPNDFGFATWFDAEINGSNVGSDLYGKFDNSCYEVCSNVTSAGTIGVDQSECGSSFDPETIQSISYPDGGSGTIEYIWLKSTTTCAAPNGSNDSEWTQIGGAVNASYNPGIITETTCYIRCARRSGCSDFVGESNVVTVELFTQLPSLSASNDGPLSALTPTVTLSASSDASNPSWSWDGPEAFSSSSQNPTTTVVGTYNVTVTDGNSGCTNTATTLVTNEAVPPPAETCDASSFTYSSNIVISGGNVSGDLLLTSSNTLFLIPTNTYPSEFSNQVYISIPEAVSYDGYNNRQNSGVQAYERWKVVFVKNGTIVHETGYTDDIEDGVASGDWVGSLMGEVFFPDGVDEIYIAHYEDDTYGEGPQTSPNSVRPSSICFDFSACDVEVTASNDGPITSAHPVVQLSATTNASNPTWSWSGPDGFSSNLQNPTTTVVGTYTVTVTDGDTGCTNSTTTEVTTQILPPPAETCDNDNFTWTSNIVVNGSTVTGDLRLKSGNTIFLIPTNTYPAEFFSQVFISIPEAVSYDGYSNRINTEAQPYEQWKVVFVKNGSVVHQTGYTEDIADGVESDDWVGSLMGEVYFPNGVDEIYIVQYEDDTYGEGDKTTANSVRPSSICFDFSSCDVVASAEANPVSICTGESSTLTANGTGGTSNYTYEWDNGAGSSASVDVSPASTTTYTVTVTDTNGCSATDDVVVTVNDDPIVTIDPAGPFCSDDAGVQLVGTPSGGTFSGQGVSTSGFFTPSSANTGSNLITYAYTSNAGCSGSAQTTIIVNESADAGSIAGNEQNCGSYDGALITNVTSPTGSDCGSIVFTGEDVCDDGGKPISFTLLYNGDECQSSNGQGSVGGKWDCNGDAQGDPNVYITTNANGVTYNVSLNQTFTVLNSNDLPNPVEITIYDEQGGNQLQYIEIHTSCSAPVIIGDQFGSLVLAAAVFDNGNEFGSDESLLVQWQQKIGSGNWTDIEGANGNTYDPGLIYATTEFRREATNCCGTDFSNVVTKTVFPPIFANAGSDQSICAGFTADLSASVGLSGEPYGFILKAEPESAGSDIEINFKKDGSEGPRLLVYANGSNTPITLLATQRARIESENTDNNNDDPKVGYDDKGVVRSLVDFNVSSISGTIDQAKLVLKSESDKTLAVGVYASPASWDEDEVTWNKRESGTTWNTPGGIESGSSLLDVKTITTQGDVMWDVTALVDAWVNGSPTGGGSYTYNWSHGLGSGANKTVSPSSTTTYTVTVTNTQGCSDTDQVTVEVSDEVLVPGQIAEDQSNCGPFDPELITSVVDPSGECNLGSTEDCCENGDKPVSFTLFYNGESCAQSSNTQGSVGGKWDCTGDAMQDAEVYISANNGQFSGIVNLNSSFTVTNGGSNLTNPVVLSIYASQGGSLLQTVEIHTSCSAPIVAGDQFGSLVLMATEFQNGVSCESISGMLLVHWQVKTTGDWTDIPGATSLSYDPPYIEETTSFRRIVTNCCGDAASNEVTMSINDATEVSINPAGPLCVDADPIQLSGNPSGGIYSGTGVSESGLFDPFVSGPGTSTITYTYEDANGCSGTAQTDIVVYDSPTVTLDPAGPLCADAEAVQLNGLPAGGSYSGTGVDANGLFDPAVSGTGTFTITYSYESGEGCSGTASIDVKVNELPSVLATASPDPVCEGEDVTLTATGSGGSGDYTYEWSDGLGSESEVIASNITANATYSVTVTDVAGCAAETSVDVTVSKVMATASDDVEICEEGTTTISVSATGGDEDYTYAWNNGAGSTASVDVSPLLTTTYTVTVTDGNGCSATDDVVVTVNDNPTVTLDPAGPLCADANAVQLNGLPAGGTYSGTGVDANGVFDPSISGTGTFMITYSYESGEGCSGTASIDVKVNELPSVLATASPDPVCEGEDVTLTVTGSGGSGDYTYEWSDGLGSENTATVQNVTATTTYSVTVTDGAGCTAETDVTVNVEAKAIVGNFVFNDLNNNGIQESGDVGIDGVSVTLYTADNEVAGTTVSENGGAYSFEVCAGEYYIIFGEVDNNIRSPKDQGADDKDSDADPLTGKTDNFTLIPGDLNNDVDAGYSGLASLGDLVFLDKDADGIQDPGEIGVDGVTVNLKDKDGNVVATTNTMNGGLYEFTGLTPGDYSVQFVLPAGNNFSPLNQGGNEATDSDADPAMNGMTEVVTLESGENNEDLDAGIYEDASIGDYAFLDKNGNGIQDDGDIPYANMVVNLKDINGDVIANTLTNGSGLYEFTGLTPGDYSVQFVLPTDANFSPLNQGGNEATDSDADPAMNGMTEAVTLESGDDYKDLDAGLYFDASIGDFVFLDKDADGIQDPGEDGVDGVTVNLKDTDGNVIATTTTMNGGLYEFAGLTPGDYSVQFVLPNGTTFSPLNAGGDEAKDSDADPAMSGMTEVVTLESGDKNNDLDAGIYEDASIGDLVFLDKDADGIQDPGEDGVDGVTVNLKDADGNVIATTTTMNGGLYEFTGLTPGDYSVQFVLPNGSTFSPLNAGGDEAKDSDADPAMNGMTEVVTLESGDKNNDLDAGIFEDASIGDLVFLDKDADGIQDPGEDGVDGVTVNLKDADGNVIATTTTMNGGLYEFTGLTPGDYSVQFVLPNGSTFSPLNEGGDEAKDSDADPAMNGMTEVVTLESGDKNDDLDAGIYEDASIGDLVFLDENGDGIQDPGEVGVDGVTVNLKDADGNVIATTTTMNGGLYEFTGLTPGEYSVQFVLPNGTTFSPLNEGGDEAKDSDADPAMNGMTELVTLESGDKNDDLDAGIFYVASIGDYVFWDKTNDGIQDGDDLPLGGVVINLTDADGNSVTDANGNPVASILSESNGSYLFDNLAPGKYIVVFDSPDNFDPTKQDATGNTGDEGDSNDDSDIDTDGKSYVVTLSSGEDERDVDAGFSTIADLNLVKRVSQSTAVVGSVVTFNIIVSNDGPHNATGVSIGDVVPNGYGNIAMISNDGELSGNEILWSGLSVPAFGNIEVTFNAEILSPGDNIIYVNIAKIETSDQFDPDSTPGNEADNNGTDGIGSEDDDTTQDPDDEDDGDDAIVTPLNPSITIEKHTNGEDADFAPGVVIAFLNGTEAQVDWTYIVTNNGDVDLVDVNVTDNIEGFICTIPSLLVGETKTCSKQGIAMAGQYTNVGSVIGTPLDPITGDPLVDNKVEDFDPSNYRGVKFNIESVVTPTNICPGETVDVKVAIRLYPDEDMDGNPLPPDPLLQLRNISFTSEALGITLTTAPTDPYFDASYDLNNDGFLGQDEFEFYWDYSIVVDETVTYEVMDMFDIFYNGVNYGTQTAMDSYTVTSDPANCASLGDYVWFDEDGDGVQDNDENGLNEVTVNLYNSSDELIATTMTLNNPNTANDGFYEFTGLLADTYVVEFVKPTGSHVFSPKNVGQIGNTDVANDSEADGTTGRTEPIVLLKGENNPNIDAGIFLPASIGDFVWNDANGNGIQDLNESGINEAVVLLFTSTGLPVFDLNGDVVGPQITGADGKYSFDNLPPGSYQVTFIKPTNLLLTLANVGGFDTDATDINGDSDADPITGKSHIIELEAGEQNNNIDAGYFNPSSIGDYVWNDEDGDGVQEDLEAGVNDIIVLLYTDEDMNGMIEVGQDPVKTTVTAYNPATDEDGYYIFEGLPSGKYLVQFETDGYIVSPQNQGGNDTKDSDINPNTGLSPTILLGEGEDITTIDAGIYIGGGLGDLVWVENSTENPDSYDVGDMPKADIVVNLLKQNDNGDFVQIATTETNTNGGYFFDNLAKGVYQVQFINPGEGLVFVAQNVGNEDVDSDADSDGLTDQIMLGAGEININVDAGFTLAPVPVELLSFNGKWNEDRDVNELTWATASELNNDYFEIERSFGNTADFIVAAKVAGNGTTFETQYYDLVDRNISDNGIYFYRLKQYDYDGTFAYSDIIAIRVERDVNTEISVYPNPSIDYINVEITSAKQEDITIQLFDMSGKLIKTEKVNAGNVQYDNKVRIEVGDLPSGIYNVITTVGTKIFNDKINVLD